ncbi:MAG: Na(+)-translocating NADH-quinone reductase subunit C [Pseudomonadota bacterium]
MQKPQESDPPVAKPKGPIGRFFALPPDSVPKTIFTAVSLCLVASMVVSAAAVSLRPTQEVNKLRDKQINIVQVAGLYDPDADIAESFAAFEPRIVDMETGEFTDAFDVATFDDKVAAEDPALSTRLDDDPASIGRRADYRTVYLLRDDNGDLDKVILPVHGYGLWSTMYGFIALEEDANEIFGLQFYEHGETPGLGAEITNPRWVSLWNGKKLNDVNGDLQITVAKTPSPAGEDYYVNALSGATLTSNGVNNLVRFWVSDAGFGPFLDRIKAGEV